MHKVPSLLWKGPIYTIEAPSLRMNGNFVIKTDNSLLKFLHSRYYSDALIKELTPYDVVPERVQCNLGSTSIRLGQSKG